MKKETKTIYRVLRNKFEDVYEKVNGSKYYWKVKDAANHIQLLQQIEYHVKTKKGECTDQDLEDSFDVILYAIQNIPELNWYKQNFSIPIINSKLNDIISTIKQGKSSRQQRVSTEISDHFKRIETQG